jgi:hypothetical protein
VDISAAVARLRDDDAANGVPVIITLKVGPAESNTALDGKYVIDQAAENSLKSIDGVVQVAEEI